MGLREDLNIEILDLVTEAARQPQLYYDYAVKYAKAHSKKVAVRERARVERIRLKQKLDEQKAKLERDVREHWDDYSPEKRTEAGVAALVATHTSMGAIQNEYLLALDALDVEMAAATEEDLMMEAARDAMAMRKSSIQVASDLYLGGYFSDVTLKSRDAKEGTTQAIQKSIKGKLKQRVG